LSLLPKGVTMMAIVQTDFFPTCQWKRIALAGERPALIIRQEITRIGFNLQRCEQSHAASQCENKRSSEHVFQFNQYFE